MDDVLNFFKDVFDFGGSLDTINFCLGLIPSWIISFVTIASIVMLLIGIIKLIVNLL